MFLYYDGHSKIPKQFRFTFVSRLQNLALSVIENLFRANDVFVSKGDVSIEQGDLVLVQKTTVANAGQIVVALTDKGNTLKRLDYENGKPILIAENSSYAEKDRIIRPRELTIQGVALKLVKDFK